MNKKMFIKFLKSRGVYDRIIELVGNKGLDFDEFYRGNKIYRLIDASCAWALTFEGHAYWQKINNDWQQICANEEPDFLMRCRTIW